ncbi:hypothetical protein KSS87_002921 [Heliosperma pusillum]|nr:hypothetical protein KSS87_002921 [Heliosperma pusillum]
MVLEATMICIDNSEWMRNGDYSPNRFQSLSDAVNLICGAKTQSNPENTVGLLTMAGKGVRVLVTPTSDLGKILACMHGLEIGGEMELAAGIQVAQLALKHRQNKKQQQRIIVFAGSPVNYEKKTLQMIGRKLKKNSVALDVVDFGEDEEGKSEKLEALVSAVNNSETSHYVHVPPGSNALSDVLISTPIFTGDGEGGSGFAAAAAAASAGGMTGFDFGVDPNLDPELALALRVSMEEERARQEAAAKKASEESAGQEKGGEHSSSQDATMGESSSANAEADKKIDLMDDENALLQQALAMSMDDPVSTITVRDTDMSDATVDDQDMQLGCVWIPQKEVKRGKMDGGKEEVIGNGGVANEVAHAAVCIQFFTILSMHSALQLSVDGEDQVANARKLLADESFVASLLASLPGVDPNDSSVKDLMASMQNQSEKKDENGPSEEKK